MLTVFPAQIFFNVPADWIPTSGRFNVNSREVSAQLIKAATVLPPDSGPLQTSYPSSDHRRFRVALTPSESWLKETTSLFDRIAKEAAFIEVVSSFKAPPITNGLFSIAQREK